MFVGRSDIIAAARNDAYWTFGKRCPFTGSGFGSRHKPIVDKDIFAVMANPIARHAQYPLSEDLRFRAKVIDE
jgi:hypothetical protein